MKPKKRKKKKKKKKRKKKRRRKKMMMMMMMRETADLRGVEKEEKAVAMKKEETQQLPCFSTLLLDSTHLL